MEQPLSASGVAGNRILVTGARGFIGAALCARLASLGAEVHGLTRGAPAGHSVVTKWWACDLADLEATRRVVTSLHPDSIIHLASYVSGAPDVELVLPTLRSNVLGTIHLLLAAHEVDCSRIVNTGTMMEPDLAGRDPLASSPYAVSKWAQTTYGRMFHDLYELPVVNLRVFMVYGPGQGDVRKLIPHVIVSLLRRERPRLTSGTWAVDWVYVDDVVEAFIAALGTPNTSGATVDVGSGTLVAIKEVVMRLVKLVGNDVEPEFGALPDRPNEFPRAADVDSAQRRLLWSPATSLDDGLRRTVDWYRESLTADGSLRL